MKFKIILMSTIVLCFSCTKASHKNKNDLINKESLKKSKPNIIYILADDLGYGDLSCYGQQYFETPNIDKLAASGIKFTQHYSGSSVCAPSRSSLMTGEHTGHTPIRGNKELKGKEGQTPLPSKSITIAELLKEAGYVTGAFGKWGLGFIESEGDPNNQGFDEFYGYNCQRMAHRYYPTHLWDNSKKELLEGNNWIKTITYAPNKIQDRTLDFIEKNKSKPFFAYVPFVLPHAELISPNDAIYKKFEGKFKEKPHTQENPYTSDYGENMNPKYYCSQAKPYATFAAMVYRLDIYVGQIMEKLEELGIAKNTIVMFSSDNGPHTEGGANPKFFNSSGGLRGVKRDLYEGGIRAPFIVSWPNKIKGGQISEHISAFWDVMPTLADIAEVKTPKASDGISFLPTLLGKPNQQKHDYLYWEFPAKKGRKAIRKGKWKAVIYNMFLKSKKAGKMELYNLSLDPKEQNNIVDQHPKIAKEMARLMEDSHVDSELFKWE